MANNTKPKLTIGRNSLLLALTALAIIGSVWAANQNSVTATDQPTAASQNWGPTNSPDSASPTKPSTWRPDPNTTQNQPNDAQQKFPPPAGAYEAYVNYVHDGDTIFIDLIGESALSLQVDNPDNLKVRLLNINTPEVSSPVECYAIAARDRLRELLPKNSLIKIAADKDLFDQYGRALLFVWNADNTMVNAELVIEGYAEAVSYKPNTTNSKLFYSLENQARTDNLGMWGSCN